MFYKLRLDDIPLENVNYASDPASQRLRYAAICTRDFDQVQTRTTITCS